MSLDANGLLFVGSCNGRKEMVTREYANLLTCEVNQKGVLDVDVVKGCTAGIAAQFAMTTAAANVSTNPGVPRREP